MEPFQDVDHDAIVLRARQLRAEAIAQMFKSVVAWLRHKPAGKTAKV